jgi:predicted dehydrogenase
MEGFMYRFHPQTRRVQELIESGFSRPVNCVVGGFKEALPKGAK